MILLGAAVALVLYSSWISGVLAGVRSPGNPQISGFSQTEYPLNRHCMVSVDPRSTAIPVVAGTANKVTGFVAPDIAEGVLIRLDADWLVLRDGCNENWIPKEKIIMIHVCD